MTSITLALFVCLFTSQALSWEALPNIPTGRRSQFLVLHEDGAYKYGYDTGDGNHAAKQEGDPSNEVKGHYFYKAANGQQLDLKYTSGVQGFQPEGLEKIQDFVKSSAPSSAYIPAAQPYSASDDGDDNSGAYQPDNSGDYKPDESGSYNPDNGGGYQPDNGGEYQPDNGGEYQPDNSGNYKGEQEPSGDASYNFNVDTPTYKRTEHSDHGGNIQGSYSYNNNEGTHDLQFVAGAETGFIAKSGSLSKPNGLRNSGAGSPSSGGYQPYSAPSSGGYSAPSGGGYSAPSGGAAAPRGALNPDGSYSFGYSADDQSREESGDVNGNVQGRYSYRNSAGSHDLSYKAGSETGFLVTGGSLAAPNGLPNGAGSSPFGRSSPSAPASSFRSSSNAPGDGSYSFGFSAGDQDRQEDSDASGNVRGRFSYRNSAGTHDLSYVAGSATGFLPTGGSLAAPNGLAGNGNGNAPLARSSLPGYSYEPASAQDSYPQDDQANSGDSSYNFSFDTPDYTRQESSDPHGNVRGSYTYRNKAGSHDLNFVAGSATGFQPTGGSLSLPNGLSGRNVPGVPGPSSYDSDSVEIPSARSGGYNPSGNDGTSGDGSYNFSFDTDEYKRDESSDANGNVRGRFSYRNSAGNHDLSFVAGSATGFKPTGGSLSLAPGLTEPQLRAGYRGSSAAPGINSFINGKSSYEAPIASVPASTPTETKASYRLGNVRVHTYLPPSNVKHKFGYIFDTQ